MKSMFQSIQELPSLIRTILPDEAQEVYRAAFNRTWEKLAAGADDNLLGMTVKSHSAARLAVQYEFTRDDDGNWRRDPVGDEMNRQGRIEDDTTGCDG